VVLGEVTLVVGRVALAGRRTLVVAVGITTAVRALSSSDTRWLPNG
jgi:hypothetical protein